MKWFRLLSIAFLMLAMLLLASPFAYADDPPDDDSDTVVDIGIRGDVAVDIKARGSGELNVGVEGPSQVYIDVDDEVRLDVEAGDESQVFVDDEKVNDPTGIPRGTYGFNTSLLGDTKALVQNHTAQPEHNARPGEESDKTMPLTILGTGAFLAGLPCFWLIRRKARKEVK